MKQQISAASLPYVILKLALILAIHNITYALFTSSCQLHNRLLEAQRYLDCNYFNLNSIYFILSDFYDRESREDLTAHLFSKVARYNASLITDYKQPTPRIDILQLELFSKAAHHHQLAILVLLSIT